MTRKLTHSLGFVVGVFFALTSTQLMSAQQPSNQNADVYLRYIPLSTNQIPSNPLRTKANDQQDPSFWQSVMVNAAEPMTEDCSSCPACKETCPVCKEQCPDCNVQCPASKEQCPACPAKWAEVQDSLPTAEKPCPLVAQGFAVGTPMPDDGRPRLTAGFIQNEHATLPSYRLCSELADTLSESLADPNIPSESRRRILESTLKLLVRNAELESQAEVAILKLKHERELAVVREQQAMLQSQIAQTSGLKQWMAPLYANQNQTQQQMQNVMTNLQLVDRTLRLLEKEKSGVQLPLVNQPNRYNQPPARMTQPAQANQPLPALPATRRALELTPRPERWSQLPTHSQPPVRRALDKSTHQRSPDQDSFFSDTHSQLAPKRLSDNEVRRQQLTSQLKQLQKELSELPSDSPIRSVGWDQPIQSNQLKPNPLKPRLHPMR